MADNDDHNPRRATRRPEDNPFIAFRHFADSQVFSLLNTIFTLPATMANSKNAHQAREQCLFGKADLWQCAQLHELEAETAELRREGREVFRQGDMQAVLEHSHMLMKLERRAEEIRRDMVDEATRNGDIRHDGHDKLALVERVANQKGRDWGAEWDWGVEWVCGAEWDCEIPKIFDGGRRAMPDSDESERARESQGWERLLRLQSEVHRLVAAFDGAAWDDPPRQQSSETSAERADAQARPWPPSWAFPPPRDAVKTRGGGAWRDTYEDLMREDESGRQRRSRSNEPHDEPSYEYSHDHEDQHDEPPSPKVTHALAGHQQQLQRAGHVEETSDASDRSQPGEETEMDTYEHLVAEFYQPSSRVPSSALIQREGAPGTPSILSTLTTTERTVTPDGLVTTKVVLKKRFANGREESSETIQTQKGDESHPRSQEPWQISDQPQTCSNGGESKGKSRPWNGWFWSS